MSPSLMANCYLTLPLVSSEAAGCHRIWGWRSLVHIPREGGRPSQPVSKSQVQRLQIAERSRELGQLEGEGGRQNFRMPERCLSLSTLGSGQECG
jgi:hypothetical protein